MIVCIVGPTGVGKTKMSIELAKKYNGVIFNCDATQIYQELNIGSAKVAEEEKEGIPHYLIDFVSPSESYTVYNYQKNLRELLEKFKNRFIIIVGGTGLYLKAGLYNYEFQEEKKEETYEGLTDEELYVLALKKDKNCPIHPHNRKRLIRFLNREKESKKENLKLLYNAFFIGLTTDRDHLYTLINQRVDKMLQEGLLEEVKKLYEKYPESKILHSAIGYKEFIPFLKKEETLENVIENIKQNSRHYAKRQYTWFNNQMDIKWFEVNYSHFDETIAQVLEYINENKK